MIEIDPLEATFGATVRGVQLAALDDASFRAIHGALEFSDAVSWDNRRLMHRVTPFDMTQPRRMWHTRIAGEPDSELAINHS